MAKTKLKLTSSEGEVFLVERGVLRFSATISNLLRDLVSDEKKDTDPIPLYRVNSATLKKVDQKTLFELILAANYMAIDKLLESSCKAVAVKIKSKSPEEIRKFFNIKCDILPDEKSAIRKANAWVDDRCDKS